jgi:ABC-type transport system substrate-binding protein
MSAAGVTTIIIVSAFARMITIRSTTRFASFVLLAVLIHTNGYAAELRVAVPAFLESSDPAKAFDASSALILGQIFEPLYVYSESNTLRPNLAVSHTISPDGKSIYVTLNPSAKFSDGSTLNAKDVVRSFEHTAAVLKREISWAMGDLEGFEEYINEPNVAKTISGIKVIADNKIEFRLKRPFPQFLQTLTVEGFAISKQSSSGLIGTGAYILASKDAHSIILKRRPDLDTDERMPTSIRFTLIPKKQNYVEFANVEKIDIGEIHDHPVSLPAGYHVERIEYLQTVVLLMNQRNAAFSTPEKRCNFSRSIEAVFQEGKYALRPLSLGIPFTWDTYSEVNKRKGVSPDKVSVTINFADSVGEFKDQLNREISHQLYKTGNSVKFQRTDLRKLVKLLRSSQFDGVLLGYVPDYFDLDALLTPFLKTGQQYNFMGYSNDEVDRLLTLARTVSDKAARLQIYKEVMSVVQHDCPIAFLGSQDSSVLVSDRWDLPKLSSLGFHKIRFKDVHYRGGN